MKKEMLLTIVGTVGGGISYILGGWDTALQTLLIFMLIDYITGLMVAGIFQKSTKTENGALNSKVGWTGLCRKGMTLFIVLIANRLDTMLGSNFIRTGVIIAYIVNESISILENAGAMGVPIPEVLKKGIELLKDKEDD